MSPALIFGKYEMLRRLAVGGMGEIVLCRQPSAGERLVILKKLLPAMAEREEAVAAFLDEARVVAALAHPNIITVHEVGRWDGAYFMAMEYLRGVDVASLIGAATKRNKGVPVHVAAQIIHDAALGLHHAHTACDKDGKALAIIHRDVSPQNIMVTLDGRTKVVDFGIVSASHLDSRTATGMIKGKLRYMPPEQLRGEPLDHRVDQYALGVVFWEILAGKHLHEKAQTPEAALAQLNSDGVPPPSSLSPQVPPAIDQIIARMLERSADARYADCKQVAEALEPFLSKDTSRSDTGHFVAAVAGDEIKERTANPGSKGGNFLIDLSSTRSEQAVPVSARRPNLTLVRPGMVRPEPARNRSSWLPLVLVLGVASATLFAWNRSRPSVSEEAIEEVAPARAENPAPVPSVSPAQVRVVPPAPPPARPAIVEEPIIVPPPNEPAAARVEPTPHPAPPPSALPPQAPRPPEGTGMLSVEARPTGFVFVDGERRGYTPMQMPLPPGSHKVQVKNHRQGLEREETVQIKVGETVVLNMELGGDAEARPDGTDRPEGEERGPRGRRRGGESR